MKFTFQTKPIAFAPKGYVPVRFTEGDAGTVKYIKEAGNETLEIGVGKLDDVTQRKYIILVRRIIRQARIAKIKKIAVSLDAPFFPHLAKTPITEISSLFAQNAVMANFEFNHYKTKPKDGFSNVEEILVCGEVPKEVQNAFQSGMCIGEEVNACRVLANTPGGIMTPTMLAKAAISAVKGLPVKVTVLGKREIVREKMGALLGVSQGSVEAPTFTIMEYKGSSDAPIVLVGKGVTFDSGGLNIKTGSGMYEMHMDMAGGASVIHAVALAAKLKLKKHIIGLIPATENMPGTNAYRPGDILKSLSGKTIEVIDTDAEGRLILADAITYAKRFKPSVVIDVATLTGAVIGALGFHANGLMTRDDALSEILLAQSEATGDYCWRLPLWDEYEDSVKGTFADIANVPNNSTGRLGGASNGGMFLWQFAKELDCPWAHLDIASRMTTITGEELAKGASGTPVRLLHAFIAQWKTK